MGSKIERGESEMQNQQLMNKIMLYDLVPTNHIGKTVRDYYH